MNPILQSALGSIIRWLLMLVVPVLVKYGIWTQADSTKYVEAAVVALLALGWSLWEKYKSRVKFLTALMPGPTTENEVDAHISAGNTPALNTPANTVPESKIATTPPTP